MVKEQVTRKGIGLEDSRTSGLTAIPSLPQRGRRQMAESRIVRFVSPRNDLRTVMEAKSNEHASRFRTMSPSDHKFTLVTSDQLRGEYDYESRKMGFLSLREGERRAKDGNVGTRAG